jgi:hypothetical protein
VLIDDSNIANWKWELKPGCTFYGFTFTDTSLATETMYYYAMDATLASSGHPVPYTAKTWWGSAITTYDPTLRSSLDSNDYWAPTALTLGGPAATTWFYPAGETSQYTFDATPGTTYNITVTNVSLTSGCSLWIEDNIGPSTWAPGSVDRYGNSTQTVTWTCPAGWVTGTDMVHIIVQAYGDCIGSYTILVSSTPPS